MRILSTLIEFTGLAATAILIVTSPAIICWAAYQIEPGIAGHGLVFGLFFGPIGAIYLSAKLWSW
mgnify:CR=1 FL=1